jgi:hypothetical protein
MYISYQEALVGVKTSKMGQNRFISTSKGYQATDNSVKATITIAATEPMASCYIRDASVFLVSKRDG